MATPAAVPEGDVGFAAQRIDSRALDIVRTLIEAGYEAYVVGGGVRDILLDERPKDFDIATAARPEEIRKLFRRARVIGRRFPIVHVFWGRDYVEVTTFRALAGEDRQIHASGRILRDSTYGTLAEDALRRDFTINALYYDPRSRQVLDFTGGLADIEGRLIRLIGDARQRYREDPVRMLRALRFAAKLDFSLEAETEAPIREMAPLLGDIAAARLFEEFGKLFLTGHALATFRLLRRYSLFGELFPLAEEVLAADGAGPFPRFVESALASTDERAAAGESVTHAFLLAALLWPPVARYAAWLAREGMGEATAVQRATSVVLGEAAKRVTVPRRIAQPLREILQLQTRFRYRHGKRAESLFAHPRFRAAWEFLRLRAAAGDGDPALAEFWTRAQASDAEGRRKLFSPAGTRHRKAK
ncbi:MAG TPA: polynucleotide adenylyltransferase PcnB [Gammaproteobacteria bacterium]|nr:polynucleotide adenylyltransferase PcnB [Gammaproteobacteria bacterium]